MENSVGKRDNSVQSVNRAISILQVLTVRGPSTVTEIATELGIHKSTIFRLLATLEARGMVDQNTTRGRYQLGYGVVQLAAGVTRRLDLSVVSRAICQELAETVGETVNIALHDGDEIISIDQVIGSAAVTTVNWAGQRSPMHTTSAGKVFLAYLPAEDRDRQLAHPLERFTEHTITSPRALVEQLETIREVGYGFTFDEQEIGLAAVAAPIHAQDGTVVAAVALSGPTYRLGRDRIPVVAEHVMAAASEISQRNGQPKPG